MDERTARAMGERRFGRVNWLGLWTLTGREIRRFLGLWSQTVVGPAITGLLFLAIFALAFGKSRGPVGGVPFEHFLAPGIIMMLVIQNAFQNTSSSVMIAKIQGNIVDTLMPPLSPGELLVGWTAGGVARGLVCAGSVAVVAFPWIGIWPAAPLWLIWFVLMGSIAMSLIGLLAAIYADKFEQTAMITNFVITPLSFLSGTFYSIQVLPEPFRTGSHLNPFFYMIDGARYGTVGVSDANPWLGAAVLLGLNIALGGWAWAWLRSGYKLKA